jgi:hypothetical protein
MTRHSSCGNHDRIPPHANLAGHHHSRAPADPVVEVQHVRIVHANAAVGDEAADSPPPLSVIAAAPMGLLGLPPGITFGSEGLSCLTSAGGDHAGRSCLLVMKAVPFHCLPRRPTPTG